MLNVSNTALAAASLAFLFPSVVFLFPSSDRPQAQGGERHVRLTNNARQPIVEIYVSDGRASDWHADLLGSDFLMPGKSVLVDIDDRNGNCRVDIKTVFDDGSERIEHGVRVCLDDGHAVSLR
jgi:hypothetical protein